MENNQLAFDVAEREFGIPPVTTGKEMASAQEPDKLSLVLYLSKFYELFRGTPLRPVGKDRLSDEALLTPEPYLRCTHIRLLFTLVSFSGADPCHPLPLRPSRGGPHPPRPTCVSGSYVAGATWSWSASALVPGRLLTEQPPTQATDSFSWK